MDYRRIIRRTVIGIAIMVLLVVGSIGGTWLWLGSDSGHRYLEGKVADALSLPGHPAVVEGLAGQPPFHLKLARLTLPDTQGNWLELDDAALDIDGPALLRWTLRIDRLSAASIKLARLPASQSNASSTQPTSFALPRLPVALELGELQVDRLELAPPVLGQAVQATIAARASLHEGQADAHLDLHRTDGVGGQASLDLAYGQDDRLEIALHAAEPTGALLAALDPVAGKRPLTLDLGGTGTLDAWSGKLLLTGGKDVRIDSDIVIGRQGHVLTIGASGDARIQKLAPAELRASIGGAVPFVGSVRIEDGKPIRLDRLKLHLSAADLDLGGTLDTSHGTLGATALVTARLDRLTGMVGQPIHGRIGATLHLSGLMTSPDVVADITGWGLGAQGYGVDHTALHLTASRRVNDGRIHLTLGGGAQGVTQGDIALPARLGGNVDIAIDATADPALTRLTIATAHIASQGLVVDAKGGMAMPAGALPAFQGHATISAADLSAFQELAGMKLGGKADLVLDADAAKGTGGTDVTLSGNVSEPKSGIAAVDALLGQAVHLDAKASQGSDGKLALTQAILKGGAVDLTASGTLDAAKHLAAKARLSLADLKPLGRVIGNPMSGSATLDLTASGTASDPAIKADLATKGLTSAGTRFDQARLTADVPRLGAAKGGIVLIIGSGRVNGRLTADIAHGPANRITIGNIQLIGTGARASGALSLDLARKLATGSLHGNVQDIAPWASLAGTEATGRAFFDLSLLERQGQGVDLDAGITNLALAGAARTSLDRLSLRAHLSNALSVPSGNLALDLTNLHSADATIAHAAFRAQSGSKGSFDFNGSASGRWHNPLNVIFAGGTTQAKDGLTVRLSRFQASLGNMPFRLQQALMLSLAGSTVRMQGLNLAIGRGSLVGAAEKTPRGVTLDLTGREIPIGGVATEAGQPGIGGTMKLDAHLSGAYQALAGQFSVTVPDLKLAAADHPELPPLNLIATASLRGGVANLQGQITTLKQETVRFHSNLPIVVAKDGSDVSIARGTALNGAINGSGELNDIASILPLGEDRLSGQFLIDLAITGTFEQPQASGTVKIDAGSYDSMASGMTLRHLALDLEGNQTALEIHQLTADDGEAGKLTGSGRIRLDNQGAPALDMVMSMAHFTATRLDEATIVTTGKTTVTGTTLAPRIEGAITIDKADVNIPDKLPPNVPTLQVTRINSKLPRTRPPPPPLVPPVVMTFAETLKSSGQVFVRGRGLDSEWRSDVTISGTNAAPVIEGTITAIHGNFSVLGKVFNVQSGTIRFTGNAIDPSLDLTAQRVANDTTVTVAVSGTVNKPKLTLSSSPALPQDEILARVLFGEGVSQMSPVQALQLAQAVASLSGQGPDVLGSLRNATGLDQLGVTSGNAASTSSGSMSGTTVTGGKYIAPGVFLGADKGIGPGTTRGRLEIEVTPHVNLNAAIGAASTSSNIGVEYHLDY